MPWRPLVGAARCPPLTLVAVRICRIRTIQTTIRGGLMKPQVHVNSLRQTLGAHGKEGALWCKGTRQPLKVDARLTISR